MTESANGRPQRAMILTTNSFVRLTSVGLRALLTLSMAVWLQPSELGLYAIVTATLTLTTYFYGLDFQTFTMRELSTADLAGARFRIRDQFTMLLVIYAVGGTITAALLKQFGLEPTLIAVVVPMAILQHATLEFYRILTRLGRTIAGTVVLLIRDAAWVPLCVLMKIVTGELTLGTVLIWWLAGSLVSAIFGAGLLFRWLPISERRSIDLAWLTAGLRTGLRMLAGTLALVGLFSVDRMIFAKLNSPDQLGAYAFFALGCASVQGLFETAILPSFWGPLLQARKDADDVTYRRAEKKLNRACLIAAVVGGAVTALLLMILAWLLPNRAYATNLHLLYYLATAYSLVTLANIPHYRLYAGRHDSLIVTANIAAFISFLILIPLFAVFDRETAVPLALAMACAILFLLKWILARHEIRAVSL